MDREFYIIFLDDNSSDKKSNLSLQDWLTYLKSDKELHLDDVYICYTQTEEETWVPDIIASCYWLGHPRYEEVRPTFRHEDGLIFCLDPDSYTLLKMIEVSNLLTGKVVDSEGRIYTEEDLASNQLRQQFPFDQENFVFDELTIGIELYSSFLKNHTFTADLRGISKNLPCLSAASFKFRLYLKDYKEPPQLYSIGRMHKLKPNSSLYEFTVTDMDTGDFLLSEAKQSMDLGI